MPERKRLRPDYFEDLYSASPDPWGFETSEYERRKYERTLGVLRDRRYRRALEVGVSIGVFTRMLAPLCDEIVGVDVSEKALSVAREKLAGFGHVRLERRELAGGDAGRSVRPEPGLAEVLYYLPREVVLQTLGRFEHALAPGGRLLAVHWRKETKTYPLQGDEVHELLRENTRLQVKETIVEPEYRLELFEDGG